MKLKIEMCILIIYNKFLILSITFFRNLSHADQ